jgi:hypothetical protein
LNGAVSKTVVGLSVHRGFESLPLRSNPARDRPAFQRARYARWSDRAGPNNQRVRLRLVFPVLAACLVCMSAGCGSSERASDAALVAERFHAAIGERDGVAACSQLSEETATKLAQQEKKPCEEAVLSLDLTTRARVAETSVYVTTASVALAEGGTLFLDEAAHGWEVSAAGCRPTAPDLPYDCELGG